MKVAHILPLLGARREIVVPVRGAERPQRGGPGATVKPGAE
jgi:hypothetical protein